MRKLRAVIVIIAMAVFYSAQGVTPVAFADNRSTMVVSPMSQKMILAPGETVIGSVNVANPNDADTNLDYSVRIGSFSQKRSEGDLDDYGAVDTDAVSDYNAMMDWITLEKESGTVAPNDTDIVKFTINVPKDAPAGGQYATILVKDESSRDVGEGNVSIRSIMQVASIIYAEVAGETREDGEIVKNVLPDFIISNPLTATSVVRNNGNVHTNAKYILQVWPLFSDEEVCTNEENPTESLIMPETERYHVESCELPVAGLFRARQTVRIFGETLVTERTVVKCPVWLLAVIVFVAIALVIWIVMRVRARRW